MDRYAPWRIDSELPLESSYSLFSKAAWWRGLRPARLLRSYMGEGSLSLRRQSQLVMFGSPEFWTSSLEGAQGLPITRMGTLLDSLKKAESDQAACIGKLWRSPVLRFCPDCICLGVHLWMQQHTGVRLCPVHLIPLTSNCCHCDQEIKVSYRSSQAAFSCTCGHSLLAHSGCAAVAELEEFSHLPQITEEFAAWVSILNAQAPAVSVRGTWQTAHLAEVCTSALQRLPVPEYMRRNHQPSFDVQLKSIGIQNGSLRAVSIEDLALPLMGHQALPGNMPSMADEWDGLRAFTGEYEESHPLVGAAAGACRRVARAHLAVSAHHACIDLLCLLHGQSKFYSRLDPFSGLARCCPVGAGFWIWKMLCEDGLSLISPSAKEASHSKFIRSPLGGNAALFLLARTGLHYCIHACSSVFAQHQSGEMDFESSVLALRGLRDPYSIWGGAAGFQARPVEVDGRWLYTSVDATELIASRCVEEETCTSRLKGLLTPRYGEALSEAYAEMLASGPAQGQREPRGASPLGMSRREYRVLSSVPYACKLERIDPLGRERCRWLDFVVSLRANSSSRSTSGRH